MSKNLCDWGNSDPRSNLIGEFPVTNNWCIVDPPETISDPCNTTIKYAKCTTDFPLGIYEVDINNNSAHRGARPAYFLANYINTKPNPKTNYLYSDAVGSADEFAMRTTCRSSYPNTTLPPVDTQEFADMNLAMENVDKKKWQTNCDIYCKSLGNPEGCGCSSLRQPNKTPIQYGIDGSPDWHYNCTNGNPILKSP